MGIKKRRKERKTKREKEEGRRRDIKKRGSTFGTMICTAP